MAAEKPESPDESPPKPAYLEALNDRQRQAALTTEGPLIVLAGAGSGKTKMLTSRIAYLMESRSVGGHHILAMTFTNKAAAEMRERVERTLNLAAHSLQPTWRGSLFGVPEIGTFHSVCVRLLRREMIHTPFTKPFVIYDDSDQLSLIKESMQKLGLDDKVFSPKSVQGAINRAKCDATEPADMEPATHDIFAKQVKRVFEQYQKDLVANNALDFGEIITMTYRLLRDNLDVRRKYQTRFKYLHVDEYQDTNRAQYLLLSMIASITHGGHGNICVVGDEDQSIYKWRGADIRNILDFERDYPGAQIVKLEQNYRSTRTIIKAAGQVIRNNKERRDKTLWTENAEGVPIVRAHLPDERAEAELAVRELKRIAADEGRAYHDFSIFYRTNAQSRQFEDVLRREKIPYQIVGGLRFYDRKEIKDVLSYFRAILNPTDSVSIKRIVNTPARGIGKTTIEKVDQHYTDLQQRNPGATWWDALQEAARDAGLTSAATARKLATFTDLVDKLMARQPELLLSELYHLVLDETGYVVELRKEGTEEADSRIENLEEFDTLLQEFEEDFYDAVPEAERDARKAELLPLFLEQSTLASDANRREGTSESTVKMMTLHSSKGLEFPVVFMVGMEEGLFPSVKPWEETPDEDIEEERRLCYVGMTRAREQLFLLHVAVRRFWGQVSYQEPARFFAEMPDDLIDFRDYTAGMGTGRMSPAFPQGSSRSFAPTRLDAPEDDGYQRSRGTPPALGTGTYANSNLVGQRIDHPEYGMGKIIAADGAGDDQKVTVEFAGRDRRKFLVRYLRAYLGGAD